MKRKMKIAEKYKWDLMLTDPRKSKEARAFGIPGYLIALCAVFVLAGLLGVARVGYMYAHYAVASFKTAEHHRENNRLREQIETLDKFVAQQASEIAQLAYYEDHVRLKYGLDRIDPDVRKAGVGGFPTVEEVFLSHLKDPLVVKAESLRLQAQALERQVSLQEQTSDDILAHAQQIHASLAYRPSIWPARGRLTSGFGYRIHPFTRARVMHEGIDIANSEWTPIYATADGIVRDVDDRTFFGNRIIIDHGNEYSTLYAHLRKYSVVAGQRVQRGDVIGYMGSTGRSTGTHLHYEVRQNGRLMNPLGFIVPEEQIVD